MASAMAPAMLLLMFCVVGFGIVSATTDPGDAAVLRNLRQIWKNTPPNWGESDDPCGASWDGIACNNSRVVKLTMVSVGLEGTLSDDIGQLADLQLLDLSYNINLTGRIPSSIGNLQKLETLSLPGCNFGGSIPTEIGNMQKLKFLALNSNNLTGGIPPSLGSLPHLDWLDLGTTTSLGQFPSPHHFNKNQLSGNIPESLFNSNMTLIHILFDGNNFTGFIPSSFCDPPGVFFPSLRHSTRCFLCIWFRNLANNALTGDIPDLTGMTNLHYVDLSNNLFTASVAPSWFSNLRSLTVLVMQYGGLVGGVPIELFRFPRLQELILRNNKFNGTVDMGTSVGSELQLVDLRGNVITGVQNELQLAGRALRLTGNPVCNAQIEDKDFCKSEVETAKYSTVSNCNNNTCTEGQGVRPRTCDCGHPYAGTLIFRGPLFRDLRNSTRFQSLERELRDKLNLGEDSVSLQDPFFDVDEYLQVHLELFPSDGKFFNRTEVQRLGSALSTQEFKPHEDEWGPYVSRVKSTDGNRRKFSGAVVAGIAAGCGALLIGLIAVGIYAVRERRVAERARRITNPFAHWATDDAEAGSAPQLNGVTFFSFNEVKNCTDNFSEDNEIGAGGYGQVYKGKLPNGQLVAIKRAKQGSMQGALEFKTEIELLSRVHHMNLVRLVGFCFEKGEQMLIYEYIPYGTLAESLSGKVGIQLNWLHRLRIALGSARGLAYLHELADPPIIHRDVKTANILLDERLTAKVADFGLSKLVSDAEHDNVSTAVKGTLGYLDPEYFATHQLTDKSDVYSFGVVMLELITGKKPIEKNRYIVREVRAALESHTPNLVGLAKFVDLAMQCVEHFSADRPTMREVVKEIESILDNDGIDSRSTSMVSSFADFGAAADAARRRHSESLSSLELSSNAFDSSAAVYILPPIVEPK
ncbi:unnamed protein product [Spirodela intermedia]|uniref:non-specific serine/threonine protein kinase n=1 Tax=Spirodela intermedia TaxID=51605 RepID=A0A7I8I9Z2_SPIIN|nr:unnamed protein product [Spirodela intermedia]CAA6654536.1 unnamed protein product [Spirodela intermedia]